MALRPCVGCSNRVHHTAVSCTRCGAVMPAATEAEVAGWAAENVERHKKHKARVQSGCLLVVLGWGCLAIGMPTVGYVSVPVGVVLVLVGLVGPSADAPSSK